MPKSLVEFIEGVAYGYIPINQQELIDMITLAKKAKDLQKDFLEKYDVDVLLRDCVLMINLYGNEKLEMATTANPNDPPDTMMKY